MNPNIQHKIKFLGYQIYGLTFNANENYTAQGDDSLNLDISVNSTVNEVTNKGFFVNIQIKLITENKSLELILNSKSTFETESEIDKDYLESPMVNVNAPAIVFPFLRAFINTISTNAGYNPIILPAINFAKFSNENKHKE